MAWVLQDFTGLEGTAAENLTFGDWERLAAARSFARPASLLVLDARKEEELFRLHRRMA